MSSSSATSASRWSATSATRADQLPVEKRRYSAWKDGHKVALVEQTTRGGDVAGDQQPTGSCVSVSFVPGAVLGSGAAACGAYAQDPAFSSPFNVVRKPTRGVELMTKDMDPSTSPESAELIRLLADCRDQEELVAAGAATWGTLSQHTSQLFMQESTKGVNRPTHKLMLVIARKKPDRGGRQLGCGGKDDQVGLELALIQKGAQAQPKLVKLVEGFRFELKREVSPQKERSEVEVRDFQPPAAKSADLKSIKIQIAASAMLVDYFYPVQDSVGEKDHGCLAELKTLAACKAPGSRGVSDELREAIQSGPRTTSIYRPSHRQSRVLLAIYRQASGSCGGDGALRLVAFKRPSQGDRDSRKNLWLEEVNGFAFDLVEVEQPETPEMDDTVSFCRIQHKRYYALQNGEKVADVGQRHDAGRLNFVLSPLPGKEESSTFTAIQRRFARNGVLTWFFKPVAEGKCEALDKQVEEIKKVAASEQAHLQHATAAASSSSSASRRRVFISDELRKALKDPTSQLFAYSSGPAKVRTMLLVYKCRPDSEQGGKQSSGRAAGPLLGEKLKLKVFKRPTMDGKDPLEEIDGLTFELVDCDSRPDLSPVSSKFEVHFRDAEGEQKGKRSRGLRDISGGDGSRAQDDKHRRKKKAATRTPRTKGKDKVNRAAASSPSSSSTSSDSDDPAENSENEGKPTKRPQVGEPGGHKDKDQGDPGSDVTQVKHLRYKGFKNGMKVLDIGQHNDRSGLHIALAADEKSRNSAEVDDAERSVAESTGLLGPFYPVREGDALAGEDGHRSSKSLVEAVKKWAQNLTADSAELKAAVLAYPGTTRLFHPTGVDDGSAPAGRPLRFLAFRKPKGYNKSDDATVVDDCALEEVASFSFDLEVVDRDEVRGRGPGAGASRSMGAMPDLLPDDFFKSRSPHIRYFGFRNGEKLLDVCQKCDEGSMTLVLSPVKGQEQSKTAVAVRQTIWNCWSLVQQSFTMKAEADPCVKDIRALAGKMAGTSELKSILLEPRTRFLICTHAHLCKTAACPQPAKTFYEMLESELQSGRPRFRERLAEQIDKHRPPADKVSSANAEAFARQLFAEKRIAFGERLTPKDAVELLARLPFQPAGQARSCVTPAEGTNLRSLRPLQLGVTRSLVHKAGAAAINPKAREMPHAVLLLNHLASTVRPEEIVFHDATSPLGATPFQGKEYLRSAQHAEKVRKFFDEELRYASINLCAYKPGCACAPHADTNASRTLMAVFGKFQGGKFRIEQTFGAARMSAPKTSAAPIRDAFVQTDTTRKNYNEEPTAIGAVEYTLSPEAEGEEHSDEFGVRWIVYDAKYRHEVTEVLSGARYSVVFVLTGGAKEYYFDKETEMTTATGMGFNKLPENLRQLKNGK
eukprot:g10096.t1